MTDHSKPSSLPGQASMADIQQLIATALQVPSEQVHPDLAFGDLPQWDSMGHMEVMLLLEERLGVEVSAETITALTSITAIINYLKEKGNA